MRRLPRKPNAFTLVEILIVVVILGILASLVVANMMSSVTDAQVATTRNELGKIESAIDIFIASNANTIPAVTAGDGTWGPIAGNRDYLKEAPSNPYVGASNSRVIIIGTGPDTEYQTAHGWIFDDSTGEVWAGGFDASGSPFPKP
ncbi:MAG: type II secretion system protein [Phycisphaerales bacterium]|nr:type II secretion system protein [Phycisphaerales bacterium]